MFHSVRTTLMNESSRQERMQAGKEGPTFPDDCVLIDVADCIGLQPILFDNL